MNSRSGDGDGRDDRNAEDLAEFVDIDVPATLVEFIHQIQHKHHRAAKLGELQREQQSTPEIFRIGHLYDRGLGIIAQHVARHPRIFRAWCKLVHTRRVENDEFLVTDERSAARDLNGGAGRIGNDDKLARELVEQNALADIGVADKHQHGLGCGCFAVSGR